MPKIWLHLDKNREPWELIWNRFFKGNTFKNFEGIDWNILGVFESSDGDFLWRGAISRGSKRSILLMIEDGRIVSSSHVHNKSLQTGREEAEACACRVKRSVGGPRFEQHIVCQVVDMPIPQLDYHILTPALLVPRLATGISLTFTFAKSTCWCISFVIEVPSFLLIPTH